MNLKWYQKLTSSELCLDAAEAPTPQQGAEWRVSGGYHGNGHLYLSVISHEAYHRDNATNGSSNHEMTITEEATPLDIWAAVKPGHVREKIAIFGSDGERTNGNEALPPGVTWDRDGGVSGRCRLRKSKPKWEEKGGAKRQRHLGNGDNVTRDPRTHKPDRTRAADMGGEELKLSVVEMVACLEKRFHQQRRDATAVLAPPKPPASFTLFGAPPPEPDSIRVSAMVMRLESDCLRTQMEAAGLKRTVGRVLLAMPHISSSPCQPSSAALSAPLALHSDREESPSPRLTAPPPSPNTPTPPAAGSCALAASREAPDPPPESEEAAPQPGSPFGSAAPPQSRPAPPEDQGARMWAFVEVRRRLQQLLEPQPFLALLPHHLLVQILALLPTRSLAALKCSCRYLRLIINTYNVRPADALWVSDPCYSDDPCKQCKKRRGRGDVSLCRWHHKPFCQALPFGPGYWMCCRSVRRDTPGCNVGLHDNRWVPAFHSRSVPLCRWSKQEE